MLGLLAYECVLTIAVLLLLQKSGLLGANPEEAVTCLPGLRAGGVIYMDTELHITALLGFHLISLICWLFFFPHEILS